MSDKIPRHRNGKPILSEPPSHRKCTRCKIVKPLTTGFYHDNGRPVLNGHEYRCKECAREIRRISTRTPHGMYVGAKQIARRTGREFTLTEVEYLAIRGAPCVYCGVTINETGLGLDRIDNDFGYVIGNVAACCPICNQIKANIFTFDEMKLLGSVVAQIRSQRPSPINKPNLGHRKLD